jgi:hypothetical protein
MLVRDSLKVFGKEVGQRYKDTDDETPNRQLSIVDLNDNDRQIAKKKKKAESLKVVEGFTELDATKK